jgi:hypothetical protein
LWWTGVKGSNLPRNVRNFGWSTERGSSLARTSEESNPYYTRIWVTPGEVDTTPWNLNQIIDCENYSNLFRFIRNMQCRVRKNNLPETGTLTAKEVKNLFQQEIRGWELSNPTRLPKSLKVSRPVVLQITQDSSIYTWTSKAFCGVKEEFGIREIVNPVFLPNKHHFTELIIKEVHSRMMHSGVKSTLTAMDHLHYRLNFDLDKNFITAWKSITKLVIFQSFVAKCCKIY